MIDKLSVQMFGRAYIAQARKSSMVLRLSSKFQEVSHPTRATTR
jgi:hypothetical protein